MRFQADYTRYGGAHLAAALTLPLGAAPGAGLAAKLPAYLRPKCAAILLDPALLTPTTLRLNVYQVRCTECMGSTCWRFLHFGRELSGYGDVRKPLHPLQSSSSDPPTRGACFWPNRTAHPLHAGELPPAMLQGWQALDCRVLSATS
jgi:hypothetical protein